MKFEVKYDILAIFYFIFLIDPIPSWNYSK